MKRTNGTSLPEQILFFYISKFFPDAVNRYRFSNSVKAIETDIFIPSLKIAVEYDGAYWHRSKESKDEEKNRLLNSEGVYVIRVREKGLPDLPCFYGTTIYLKHRNPVLNNEIGYVSQTVAAIFNYSDKTYGEVPAEFELTEEKYILDLPAIYSHLFPTEVFPSLDDYCGIQFWEYEKNFPLLPENIPADEWAHAYMKCPDGKERLLPRYHRSFKHDCEDNGYQCSSCFFNLMCPFLNSCKRIDGKAVQCKYIEDKIMRMIDEGIPLPWEYIHSGSFSTWFVFESDCTQKIAEAFLKRKTDYQYRNNIVKFFGLEHKSETFVAWTESDAELFEKFRAEICKTEDIMGIEIDVQRIPNRKISDSNYI